MKEVLRIILDGFLNLIFAIGFMALAIAVFIGIPTGVLYLYQIKMYWLAVPSSLIVLGVVFYVFGNKNN